MPPPPDLKLQLDRNSAVSLSDQVYDQIKQGILQGKLRPGEKLPSSRQLAETLGVSRPTIFASYRQLEVEGFVRPEGGSGYYVSQQLESYSGPEGGFAKIRYSTKAKHLHDLLAVHKEIPAVQSISQPEIAFSCWRPSFAEFPKTEWARVIARAARNISQEDMDFALPQGALVLRKQIAKLVAKFRGLDCDADQIIITAGLSQALSLAADMSIDIGSTAFIEEPGYDFARFSFILRGAKILASKLDNQGMQVPPLLRAYRNSFVYVTPSHQFPTGTTMSLKRRLELLDWARRTNSLIFEDDFDSEYQSGNRPIPALMSLDTSSCVVYAGTLNQLLFPSLGIGYLIVPKSLSSLYAAARKMAGEQIAPQLQHAIADFMAEGELEKHVRRLQNIYSEKRQFLSENLKQQFGDRIQISGNDSGVFLVARFDTSLSADEFVQKAGAAGVGLLSSKTFYISQNPQNEYVLGFADLEFEQMREGITRLKSILT